ncbi:MAG: 6-phosphogluconolactonase [Rhodanobacter sp.]
MSPLPEVTTHRFSDSHAQALALAERIATDLRQALAQRGQAVLAVSGGSTPRPLFAQLARAALDWTRVQVTLVDERWVPVDDARSNAALVQSTLLRGEAGAANFVPLYTGAATPEEGVATAAARIDALPRPFDAVVLGVGDDGHTASFFPGGDHLAAALDPRTSTRVLPMRAPDAGEPRITLTLNTLLDTRALYVLISGERKLAVVDAALHGIGAGKDYPIRAVLTQQRVPVAVYWCP